MPTEVNLLIRGQSNAWLFVSNGGAAQLERQLEASMPDVDIKILAKYDGDANTIYSATAFLNWDTGGQQQGLLDFLEAEPAGIQDNPTLTVWMHNEYDSNTNGVTTSHWVSEVQADATLVRAALGQGAATTPYVFTYVPYNYTQGNSAEAIQAGMRQLSADGSFNASFATEAMTGIAMDGDGYANSSHMGWADAILVADRLAVTMADTIANLAGPGGTPTPPVVVKPVDPAPTPTPPSVNTTPVVQTIGSGSDTLVLRISQDVYLASAQYTVSVDGKQIGGTLTAGASTASGQDDIITVKGDWAAGAHKVTVDFLNDAWGGTGATDRNLVVDSITYNGKAVAGGSGSLNINGPVDFAFTEAAVAPPIAPPVPPPVGNGTGAIPALFGTPGTWGQAAQVWSGQLDFGGDSYQTFGAHPAWGSLSTVQLAPKAWDAAWDTDIAVDNFVTANLNLRAAGTRDLDVMVVSAQNGAVQLGNGDDTITWVAHSNAGIAGNNFSIKTGGGDDTVHLTAAGLTALADYDKTGNGSLYNAGYDGTGSNAHVTLGAGHDTVVTEGGVRLVLNGGDGVATATGSKANDLFYAGSGGGDFTGGAGRDTFILDRGDGHVTIQDFTSGADRLKFIGFSKADIHTTAATEGGVAGLLVTYDAEGDSIFLAHVSNIGAADMLFT